MYCNQTNKTGGEKNMKMRRMCTLLILVLALASVGCGKKKQDVAEQATEAPVVTEAVTEAPTEAPTETPAPTEVAEEEKNEEQLDKETPIPTPEEDKLWIYYGDENAENLLIDGIEKQKVTPELLISELAKRNVISEDTKINSIKETKTSGKKTLALDFSEKFQEELFNQGSSGEFIMMGSVVNTFLRAYEADSMTITVNGNILESGHCIYESPMKAYEPDEDASSEENMSGIVNALGVE